MKNPLPVRDAEVSYNTNLAAEYLVMSLLCRSGIHAYLSLGNKKGVDILATTTSGATSVIEVKGVNKRNDWLVCNTGKFAAKANLFYALICFNGTISDLTASADFWFIPSEKLAEKGQHKVAGNEKTVYISNKHIQENFGEYKNNISSLRTFLTDH